MGEAAPRSTKKKKKKKKERGNHVFRKRVQDCANEVTWRGNALTNKRESKSKGEGFVSSEHGL